jgi:hypothetical protein
VIVKSSHATIKKIAKKTEPQIMQLKTKPRKGNQRENKGKNGMYMRREEIKGSEKKGKGKRRKRQKRGKERNEK